MPQGVEVVETGRLMIDAGRTVLLRDDGGEWGLFFERDLVDLVGQRVTVRGNRYGFGMLHVTAIARGNDAPPSPQRRTDRIMAGLNWLMDRLFGHRGGQ